MIEYTVAQELSDLVDAMGRSSQDWKSTHQKTIHWIENQFLPRGAGFDNGTQLDQNNSNSEKLVFQTAFHHMNDGGFYDGWTYHTVHVWPQFRGFRITISGPNKNDIKDYIHENMYSAMGRVCRRIGDPNCKGQYGWFSQGKWEEKEKHEKEKMRKM